MNALLFTNLFPTPTDPLCGTFTRQLARELARLCDLTVAVPVPWFPGGRFARRLFPGRAARFGFQDSQARVDGFPVHYLRYPLVPKISERLHPELMWHGVNATLRKLHDRRPFEVINAHWLYPDGIVAVRAARLLGVPVVLSALGCDVNEFLRDPAKRPRIVSALTAADAVTAVSDPLAATLAEAGIPACKIAVVANGVDLTLFRPRDARQSRSRLGLPADESLVVCVSRLSLEKGVRYLVEALPALRAHVKDARVAIIGDGPDRHDLMRLARALHVDDAVTFTGSLPHEKVADWFAAADVTCIPSLREGHPNAALEALASGRPIVASRVGALGTMIRDGLGFLVAPQDVQALAEALKSALTRTWNAHAIAHAVRPFSWSAAADGYVKAMNRARHADAAMRGSVQPA